MVIYLFIHYILFYNLYFLLYCIVLYLDSPWSLCFHYMISPFELMFCYSSYSWSLGLVRFLKVLVRLGDPTKTSPCVPFPVINKNVIQVWNDEEE